MGSEMIERVEKAIHEALSRADVMAYLDMPEDAASIAARAALQALMEPSEAMTQAGQTASSGWLDTGEVGSVWQAMIQKALEEGK